MTGPIDKRSSTPTPGLTAGVLTVGGLAVVVGVLAVVHSFGWLGVAAVLAVGALSVLAVRRHTRRQSQEALSADGAFPPSCMVCGGEFDPADGVLPLPAGRPGETGHVHDGECLRRAAELWAREVVREFGPVRAVAAAYLLGEGAKEPDFQSVYDAVARLSAESSGGAR